MVMKYYIALIFDERSKLATCGMIKRANWTARLVYRVGIRLHPLLYAQDGMSESHMQKLARRRDRHITEVRGKPITTWSRQITPIGRVFQLD